MVWCSGLKNCFLERVLSRPGVDFAGLVVAVFAVEAGVVVEVRGDAPNRRK